MPELVPRLEAFDHPEHRNADAHLASFYRSINVSDRFASKPDRQLVMDSESRHQCRKMQTCGDVTIDLKWFFSRWSKQSSVLSKRFAEVHLHAETLCLDICLSLAQILPIFWQLPVGIDDINLLNTQGIYVADHRSDVLDVGRVFNHRDEVLATKRSESPRRAFEPKAWIWFHPPPPCL